MMMIIVFASDNDVVDAKVVVYIDVAADVDVGVEVYADVVVDVDGGDVDINVDIIRMLMVFHVVKNAVAVNCC